MSDIFFLRILALLPFKNSALSFSDSRERHYLFFFSSSFGVNRGAASQRKRLFPGNEAAGKIIITVFI